MKTMRRLMMGFAACALIMTSCAKQEITETVSDGRDQLSFAPGLGKQSTKAAEMMNSTLKLAAETDGITIYAYHKPEGTWTKWFDDEQVIYDPTAQVWKLKNSTRFRNKTDTKYITYFSQVAGALTVTKTDFTDATFTGDAFPKFNYTVANNIEQEDLIAGITEGKAGETDITLGMRHILSQVNFGTVGYKGAKIAIRDIKIVGLFDSGTYIYDENNTYPIGKWDALGTAGTATDRTATYDYLNYANTVDAVDMNDQPVVFAPTTTGEIYIFGDGGNAGPGRNTTTWYPIKAGDNGWANAHATNPTALANSLMLMPQAFTGDDAKVTFEYRITDVDDVYVAGDEDNWEKGEFKLDFSTGTTPNTHYMAKWEQNFRYVYLIDFTDFLEGNAISFTVDVEMYPWENYNGDGDGEVIIIVAGQPTQANMNADAFVDASNWYVANQSQTAPADTEWAQVIRDETWDLSAYNFTNIEESEEFVLNFKNVIFNTSAANPASTTIQLTLPAGYEAVNGTGIVIAGNAPTYTISAGDKSVDATITVTNKNKQYSTGIGAAIAAVTTTGTNLIYKGKTPIDLTKIEPTLTTAGDTMTVKFSGFVKPKVGDTATGTWTWVAATQTATWTIK